MDRDRDYRMFQALKKLWEKHHNKTWEYIHECPYDCDYLNLEYTDGWINSFCKKYEVETTDKHGNAKRLEQCIEEEGYQSSTTNIPTYEIKFNTIFEMLQDGSESEECGAALLTKIAYPNNVSEFAGLEVASEGYERKRLRVSWSNKGESLVLVSEDPILKFSALESFDCEQCAIFRVKDGKVILLFRTSAKVPPNVEFVASFSPYIISINR